MDSTAPERAPARLPPALSSLLVPVAGEAAGDGAWHAFVDEHDRLLRHVCRSLGGDVDAERDRYAYVLEQLRADDFHRLRKFAADGRGKFTTWLTVVARRICLDHERSRYGRASPASDTDARDARRRLTDLVAVELDPDRLGATASGDPIARLEREEARAALHRATSSLGAEDRLLLALRFADELSAREIAEVVGLPSPFHVYRRLNAILARLRASLVELGIEESPA
ncbi:MAG: sigma-70 family RNA polymerase sigma factor [marine benthic group bacterium]|jgi:RNA polymerase sigma factor (sigma-70 family)|nr:sigma-70 family RNA polymerase sigma factor [Gemmatimonadota bacterium]